MPINFGESVPALRFIRSAMVAAAPPGGPPLRMIIDSGIHVGAGSDSAQISTLDQWNIVYYMVTGKSAAGKLGQCRLADHA